MGKYAFDVYQTHTGRKSRSHVTAEQAEAITGLDKHDIHHWVEEKGRVDSDIHTVLPHGAKFPGSVKEP